MAASALQIDTNRVNAQHSTGPRNQEGKQKSSRNSEKHNLTGGWAFVEGEDREAYEAHIAAQFRQYKPLAEHEIFLTRELAGAMWRLDRARRMESELLEKSLNPFACDEEKIAIQLERLTLYISAIERTYYKAYNELKKISAERNVRCAPLARSNFHDDYSHQPLDTWERMRARIKAFQSPVQNEATPRHPANPFRFSV